MHLIPEQQSTATKVSLSAEFAAFVDAAENHNSADGVHLVYLEQMLHNFL